MSTVSLTYQEIAARRSMTVQGVRNWVRRMGWPKTLGNDGVARIMLPSDALPPEPPMRGEGSIVQPLESGEGSTVQPPDASLRASLEVFARHIEELRAEPTLRAERDEARDEAARLREALDAKTARAIAAEGRAAAAEAELERILTERDRTIWQWLFGS